MVLGSVRRRARAASVAGAMLAFVLVLHSQSFCFLWPVPLDKADGRSLPALGNRGFLSQQQQAPEMERAAFRAASLASFSASMAGLVATALRLRSRYHDAGAQRRRCGRARSAVARAASEEEKLMKLIGEFPEDFDQDDMQEVSQAFKKLPGVPGDAFEQLVGTWKAEWGSRSGRAWPKGPKSPVPLKFRSLQALPPVPVQFLGKYSRVLDVRDSPTQPLGGVFEVIEVFTVPGSEGVEAALVLSGPWKTGSSEGEWGRGAPRTRCGVQFQTARVVPSTADPEASTAMLEAAGLKDCLKPVAVDAKATYVDIEFISGAVRVDKEESGAQQVFTRMSEAIPFALD